MEALSTSLTSVSHYRTTHGAVSYNTVVFIIASVRTRNLTHDSCILQPWIRRQYVSPKHSYLPTSLHCVTTQNNQHRHPHCRGTSEPEITYINLEFSLTLLSDWFWGVFLFAIVQWFSNCGARSPRGDVGPLGVGRELFVWGTFILNEVRAQHKTYVFRHFAWLKYFTYHVIPVLLSPNCKQQILSSDKLRKLCYSLPEIYVKYVYLNLFGWRRLWSPSNFLRGARAIKVREPLL
jgi:hypothetical protein